MALLYRTFLPLFLHICLLSGSAWAKVELSMHESVEVYLGDSAQIPCQYSFTNGYNMSSFVMIQWFVSFAGSNSRVRIFYADGNQQIADNNTEYTGRITVTSDQKGAQLTIQDIQISDKREFFCQVNGLAAGNAEGKTHLRVFARPEAPVIEGVLDGISVTNKHPSKVASCEARNGFPKPNITWYKNGVPLISKPGHVKMLILVTREYSGFYSVQSTLEYKVVKEDKDALFSCEVSFFVPGAVRTVESDSINITVHYPTTMVKMWKESPQGLVKEGDTVKLRCQGDGNPPPLFFIFNRTQEPDKDLKGNGDSLILPPVSRKDSGIYQCRPLDIDGDTKVKGEMQLTVHYLDPAVVEPKDSELVVRGEHLIATCNALSSLKTHVVWYKDGKQVGQNNTLPLNDATYETTGEYTCEVSVPSFPALHTSGSVHIIVHGGPQLLGVDQVLQAESAGRVVNLSCEAVGYPVPSISWNIVGSQSWDEVVSKANEHMAHSVVSVKVTSDINALCNVSNNMGAEVKIFSIKAIPSITSAAPFSPAEGSGVIIVVIILCLLLLATLGSILYFLHKKGKILCGRSGKQEITKEKTTKDDIVVEMKTNTKNEEAILLKAVNGDKKGPNDQ